MTDDTAAPSESPSADPAPLPRARIQTRVHFSLWLIWLVPLVAVVVGLGLGIQSILSKGPEVSIRFRSAEGLEAGKTRIKYKDVEVGRVKDIHLLPDHVGVEVRAEFAKGEGVEALLVSDTRFWVVRPQVGANGVTGLGTLFSGAYIGMDIGHDTERQRDFHGLDVPPVVTSDTPGRRFRLKAQNMGSLTVGSPVYFRRVPVGQVVGFDLDREGRFVNFSIFVNSPYDRFVNEQSRFWHASGVDLSLSAEGMRFSTESLASLMVGGVAFQDLTDAKDGLLPEASVNTQYTLHADRAMALKQPDGQGVDYQMLFEGSVRGLSVGAGVDFRGLPIGEVTDIAMADLAGAANPKPLVAVTMRIYPSRLPTLGGRPAHSPSAAEQRAALGPMVAHGFRAQLRNGNLLTGSLYVALDFFPGAAAASVDWRHRPPRFPTIPASLDTLQASLNSLAQKLDRLPLDQLGQQLQGTLSSAQQTLQQINRQLDGLGPEAKATLVDTRKTLSTLQQTLSSVEQSLGPQAALPMQAAQAMVELGRAAQSLRSLADTLERHPEALLRGKPEDAP